MPELGGITTYPIGEPSSALAFSDLIIEVAYKIGCAYYGSDGQGEPQMPVDSHDLILCKRIVNNGIRMFINDAPPEGWSWSRPIAQVDLWGQIDAVSGSTSYVTSTAYVASTNLTTLSLHVAGTVNSSTNVFFPSMELKTIYLGGNPPTTVPGFQNVASTSTTGVPFTIVNYLNASTVQVYGQPASSTFASTGTASTSWSMVADGDYTLPADFSGQYAGAITYVGNTNRGSILQWSSEQVIRGRRQNYNFETGTPYQIAVRLMPTPSLPTDYAPQRRRWQLMAWRTPNENLHVLFPYVLGFQNLVNDTDTPPSPFAHDEALKAACLAVAEKQVTDSFGLDWNYYKQDALPKSYRIDRLNAPKRLGYFGNPNARANLSSPIETFRDSWYQRPTVPLE
jgi:hypothetical protein